MTPASSLSSQALAHVEAFIDFSEDELIEDGVLDQGGCPVQQNRLSCLDP